MKRFVTLILLAFILAVAAPVRRGSGANGDSFEDGEIIVGLVAGADISAFNTRHGTTTKEQINGIGQYLLELAAGVDVEAKLVEIAADPEVLFSGPNYHFQNAEIRQQSQAYIDQQSQAYIDGNSPVNFFGQTQLSRLHLTEAQQYSRGTGIRVAVIDTGLDFSHPMFAGRIAYPNYDFVDEDGDPREVAGGNGYGHGTFVAGLISLIAPNTTIMPLRAFGPDGSGTSFNIARAIRFATDNGAQVINLSFGLLSEDNLIEDALEYAYSKTYLVASAGNDNLEMIHFPASEDSKTMSVTSVDANDIKADFANFNREMQVAAPGVDLYSAYPGGRWATWSGTSFSTALVSGEAALLLYLNPALNRSALNTIITTAGVKINAQNPGYSDKLGDVRIDFLTAIQTLGATPLDRASMAPVSRARAVRRTVQRRIVR